MLHREVVDGCDVRLLESHIDDRAVLDAVCVGDCERGIHDAEGGRLELLEEELRERLDILRRPCWLGDQEYRGVECRR